MKFNQKLKELRKEKSWSQEELAEKLNVSRQAVTKWEAGESYPDIENLKCLSTLLGKTIDELVKEDYESTEQEEKNINEDTTSKENTEEIQGTIILENIDNEILTQTIRKIEVATANLSTLIVTSTNDTHVSAKLSSRQQALVDKDVDLKIKRTHNRINVIVKKKGLFPFVPQLYTSKFDLTVFIPVSYHGDLEISTVSKEIITKNINLNKLEISSTCSNVFINNVNTISTELNGVVKNINIDKFTGNLEINSVSANVDLTYREFTSNIEINSVSSQVKLNIPKDSDYRVEQSGISSNIIYLIDNKPNDRIRINGRYHIELNGVSNTLTLNEYTE